MAAVIPLATNGPSEPISVPAGLLDAVRAEKAKILVVDDRSENLLVARTMLEELGQEIITARSGDEALKHLLEHDVAVILLDVNMPGMDGLETATYVRKRQKTRHTPIIFLTAYVEEMHTAKGYSLGAVDYILTPVMPEILRTKVKVFVELHLMTRQAERQANERIALASEQAARAAAEEATRRSTFLAAASDVLSSSLDVTTTVKALAQFVVPALADLSVLTLVDDQGQHSNAEIAWTGHGDGGAVSSESATRLDAPAIDRAIQDALTSGSAVVNKLDAGISTIKIAQHGAADVKTLELGIVLHSLAVLPLVARGRRLGTLTLALAERRVDAPRLALAKDVAARTAVALDNCLLYAKIQEADRRKNEFLAMLAHELRNPLAPVRNAVQILRMAEPERAQLDWATDVIDRQTQQLVRLVDDLLDVARITQGKITLKLEPVEVASVVALAVEMTRHLIESRNHELAVAVPKTPLFVHGDHSRVAQILANLLNNAAKYSESRGYIALSAEEDGADVVFRVRDSGTGIPKEMLGSIFELFTQADRSLDRSQGGLGIGLTIVRSLVNMQHGTVHAHSSGPHKGSEFVVRLPRAVGASASAPSQRAPSRRDTAHRVLIVDDYADAAESMAALMAAEGQEVRVAHDGPTAIEIARAFKPSVVLLDIGLPGMNGFEVARVLRATPETKDSLLIAVSGYGQADDHRQSKEAGFDRHLIKPVDLPALHEIFDSTKNGPPAALQA